jgi:Flp pilus assembly protein TadG
MYGHPGADHNLTGTYRSGEQARSARILGRGSRLGPRGFGRAALKERRQRADETGAEMIEFAIVVVLLVALIYGIVSFGLILACKVSITQATADGARAGIVMSTPSAAETAAVDQTANDLGWLGLGSCTSGTEMSCLTNGTTCPSTYQSNGVYMCISSTEAACASSAANTCLNVALTYYYASDPIFPEMPGLNVITPNVLTSSSSLQISTPT